MPLHNACYDFNDEILLTGAEYFAEIVRTGFRSKKNKKRKGPEALFEESTGFFDLRQVEGLTQCTHKCLIVTDGFARAVGEFRHRLAVTFHQFITIFRGFT
jgi:hypothetical protein